MNEKGLIGKNAMHLKRLAFLVLLVVWIYAGFLILKSGVGTANPIGSGVLWVGGILAILTMGDRWSLLPDPGPGV